MSLSVRELYDKVRHLVEIGYGDAEVVVVANGITEEVLTVSELKYEDGTEKGYINVDYDPKYPAEYITLSI